MILDAVRRLIGSKKAWFGGLIAGLILDVVTVLASGFNYSRTIFFVL
ncbi:MAG: hypothetical protein GY714_32700 [Desulfobacterales bacterium]|nr:hypothetical protein [Desulfobacterales bacterium]MCP4159814.1 hypothetical protein [Deltaproteobacteria bacterium]